MPFMTHVLQDDEDYEGNPDAFVQNLDDAEDPKKAFANAVLLHGNITGNEKLEFRVKINHGLGFFIEEERDYLRKRDLQYKRMEMLELDEGEKPEPED